MSRLHRCYLLDDEELSLAALDRILRKSGRVEVVGRSADPAAAIEELQRLQPAVLFLDIQMPEMDGFDVLSHLPFQPFVVFTTAFDKHALRAFDSNAIDYLLKPVEEDRLARALDKLDSRWANGGRLSLPRAEELAQRVSSLLKPREWLRRIATPRREGVSLIDVRRITHFLAEDRACFACTEQGRFPVNSSLSDLEARLDPAHFQRVHRSAIVNLDFVDHVSGWFAGRLYIRLRNADRTELTVSREKVSKLRQALGL